MELKGTIEDWGTVPVGDCFTPPECAGIAVNGKFGERYIRTSPVVATYGHIVRTWSGSFYKLGNPSREFLEFLASEGLELDPVQPIKVKHK